MSKKDVGEIFTLEELCKYLKISKHTIYKFTQKQNKKIPCFKVGRELRFSKKSIEAWIAKQENDRIRR